ncbi:BZ3500_MvSof-1268-A1-R1_Chr1-1g01072 [Microbotryum saponariae]|uniref:BZ3500_MvSof-1268-A1-R1_Chr1-1g01072 protein n=1 Tax=Microbotryum saponariae TaxID=289078 RepID=A0A2X0K882_9BASI|nr:BZ3500_MvSof-1268-A1-R1_Chr1-1g01072 [Microbotryum saponariae]SCZ93357.1 BZ3501_MvSof-1269-A2-R1_Chr1-1g00669 [Microbotryum saponariae]
MWCLRYWAFLPLLPFPTASPLWQLLYLLSMMAANRTCVYCTALLVALFMASCFINLGTTYTTAANGRSMIEHCRCWLSTNAGDVFSPLPSLMSNTTLPNNMTTCMTNATQELVESSTSNTSVTPSSSASANLSSMLLPKSSLATAWSRMTWLKKSYVLRLGKTDASSVRIDFGL